ncbi:PD-(D/E)XK nuclease family protein [Catalinimonas sp. 4WD22]|uniref:PDDEXK-like family protein n=1 Tax=Catalinimonas locisalis TaxID=3133978 RepID=UPI0031013A9C
MTEEILQREYLNFIHSQSVSELDQALSEPNIFQILNIEHRELMHSNFLAWLMQPNETHGLGCVFIKSFLREIFIDNKAIGLSAVDAEKLDYEKLVVLREWRNIDLFLRFPNLVICIENKIHHSEDPNQLTKYRDIILGEYPSEEIKKVFIFLTPYGTPSIKLSDIYIFCSYNLIANNLNRILITRQNFLNNSSKLFLQNYYTSIQSYLMNSSNSIDIAREIYQNHRKLIEFIYAHRPIPKDDFMRFGKEFLQSKGLYIGSCQDYFIRFLPQTIKELVPVNMGSVNEGWANGEAFLFEFKLHAEEIAFQVTAAPTRSDEEKAYRNFLETIMPGYTPDTKTSQESWIYFYWNKISINIEDGFISMNKAMREFQYCWDKCKEKMEAVEQAFLENKDELIKLKEKVDEQLKRNDQIN